MSGPLDDEEQEALEFLRRAWQQHGGWIRSREAMLVREPDGTLVRKAVETLYVREVLGQSDGNAVAPELPER
jgi:hypothetical protein